MGSALSLAAILLLALAGCAEDDVAVQGDTPAELQETDDPALASAGDQVEQVDDEIMAEDTPDSAAASSPDTSVDVSAETPLEGQAGPPGSGLATGRPYVVIRFPDSSTDYQDELANAVRRAVERKPNVAFDLVAVTPRSGSAGDLEENTRKAKQQAAEVLQSLLSLGIGADRIAVAAWTGQPTKVNEIRLYIR
jgi:type IV pilus biogenesis protein CpaD/CtpE